MKGDDGQCMGHGPFIGYLPQGLSGPDGGASAKPRCSAARSSGGSADSGRRSAELLRLRRRGRRLPSSPGDVQPKCERSPGSPRRMRSRHPLGGAVPPTVRPSRFIVVANGQCAQGRSWVVNNLVSALEINPPLVIKIYHPRPPSFRPKPPIDALSWQQKTRLEGGFFKSCRRIRLRGRSLRNAS